MSNPTSNAANSNRISPWPHRFARLMVALTFPLIWVGGLVTTYDAGMAVPDWPGTYGYNLFLYPWQTWIFGPFDLLVEHGHRLLGALVGMVAIGFVVASWLVGSPTLRKLSIACLAAVICQGLLGGMRVVLDARTLAMIHGCFAQAFFALAVATTVSASPKWNTNLTRLTPGSRIPGWAILLLVCSYLQVVFGAQLRHILPWASPKLFMAMVHIHLTLAGLVFVLAIGQFWVCLREQNKLVSRPAKWIVFLVLLQISLGIGTWIVNYALPWEELWPWLARYTIQSKGFWESMIVTAHVATGSLITATAAMVATRAWILRTESKATTEGSQAWKTQQALVRPS